MTRLLDPPRHNLSPANIRELVQYAQLVPVSDWSFRAWPFDQNGPEPAVGPQIGQVAEMFERELWLSGFVVVGLAPLLDDFSEPIAAAATTLLLASLGYPLTVFSRHPHWRRLGVDTSRPPEKSGGAGRSPFHMDFVNAENPPDLVCLLCLRPDPCGGGESLLADLAGVENLVSHAAVQSLRCRQFRDGRVVDLAGIGGDINPFPILDFTSRWKYRFTGNLLNSAPNAQASAAILELTSILNERAVSFILAHGDLLIIDQHRMAHGRGAIAGIPSAIADEKRRLLLHSFVCRN